MVMIYQQHVSNMNQAIYITSRFFVVMFYLFVSQEQNNQYCDILSTPGFAP